MSRGPRVTATLHHHWASCGRLALLCACLLVGASAGTSGYYFMPYAYLTGGNLASDFWVINAVDNLAIFK